jgi:hypothetical protein
MPRESVNLDPYRDEISHRILDEQQPVREVLNWLASEGITVSQRTLERRISEWKVTRYGLTLNQDVIDRIGQIYHTTRDSDTEIAEHLNTDGYNLSHWQVQRVRWSQNWRRRAANDEQKLAQRTETFQRVEQALNEGTARNYGRGHLEAYLRSQKQYPARHNDLRDAIKTLDREGTQARKLGPKKRRQKGEYITRGPDWL